MRPVHSIYGSEDDRLTSLTFGTTPAPPGTPINNQYKAPILVENGSAGTMFWQPTWRERIRLLFGYPVRVNLCYSLYGPMHLDTERNPMASVYLDW